MINLASPATGRDNLRQAEADLIQFTKSIPALRSPRAPRPGRPVGVDPTRISYTACRSAPSSAARTSISRTTCALPTLVVPGGVLTRLLLDSQTFGRASRRV